MNTDSFLGRFRHSSIFHLVAIMLVALALGSSTSCGRKHHLPTTAEIAAIHDAAMSGDLEKVKALLKDNPDLVFSKDAASKTPLYRAAALGHKDVAELLLTHGADINAGAPLIGAAYYGHTDMVDFLLAHGADVNARTDDWTPLLAAVAFEHKDVVAKLLAHGADVNATNNIGTSLYWAISTGQTDILELLLAHHPNVAATFHDGLTTLHLLASAGLNDSLEWFLTNNAEVNARDDVGETPMHLALVRHHNDTAELLRKHGGVNMDRSNTIENSIGDLAVVKILLKDNPGLINNRMRFGITPLALAADRGCKDVAEFLLDGNADVNAAADSPPFAGWTPLLFAVSRYGDDKNAEDRMLDDGIEYHANGHGGPLSPIMSPDATFAGKKDVAELLLAHGANVNARESDGTTSLLVAAKNDDKDMALLLLAHGADVNAKKNDSSTPLHDVAGSGYKDMVELLLANQADVNGKNQHGETALHFAAQNGNKDVVELLLTKGADVNAKTANTPAEWGDMVFGGWDIGGQTPLHNAAAGGHKDAVELLLAHGAEVNATNNYGWTSLHFAADHGHTNVVELLSQHGGTNDLKPPPPIGSFHGPLL
jgi:cytohesin